MFSFWELSAAPDYDVFTASDWRNTRNSMLTETYGGTVYSAAQCRVRGKAFVMGHTGIAHPRPYASDLTTLFPAYAGLQDWDGVFFSIWSDNARSGADKVDSNSTWNIVDKPGILAMLPVATSMIRSGSVLPSDKELVIDNTREDIEQPRFHATSAFSMSISTDLRIPVFRRMSMNGLVAERESFLPHRDISALSDQVDVSALDAENEQIFWNAAEATFRVETPRHIMLSGGGEGRIVSTPSFIVEQTTTGAPPAIGIASLTSLPIAESPRSLLVVGSRAQNSGQVYDPATGRFTTWGTAPLQMEGVGMRITLTAPSFDTLRVIPLGPDGRASRAATIVERRTGGRFPFTIATNDAGSPWFRLEFAKTSTSVDEDPVAGRVVVAPNPVNGSEMRVQIPDGADRLDVVDMTGAVVSSYTVYGGTTAVVTSSHLPSGAYAVRVHAGATLVGSTSVTIIR
jgi:hypothetical protein